jgi:hypothetical protein
VTIVPVVAAVMMLRRLRGDHAVAVTIAMTSPSLEAREGRVETKNEPRRARPPPRAPQVTSGGVLRGGFLKSVRTCASEPTERAPTGRTRGAISRTAWFDWSQTMTVPRGVIATPTGWWNRAFRVTGTARDVDR